MAEKTAGELVDPEDTVCTQVHPRAGPICKGCRARQSGHNCWEMDVSPCCDLPREWCNTCPVHAAAMRVLTVPVAVTIYMTNGSVIHGTIHARKTMRLSDELNDTDRRYIAVTEATVTSPSHVEPNSTTEPSGVVLLSKRAIEQVIPVDEKAYEDMDGADPWSDDADTPELSEDPPPLRSPG